MKRRIYLDTNVILDFLGERRPFYESIAKVATLADRNELILVASPLSYATISYILSKFENKQIALKKLRKFRILSEVCSTNEQIVDKSLNSDFNDFKDALHYMSALESNCDMILTRNGKDFKRSVLPVMTPDEFLSSRKQND